MKPLMKRRSLGMALTALIVAGVAGCGRKGDLKRVKSTNEKTEEKPKSE
jgi:predicted small lipoprotein YifL